MDMMEGNDMDADCQKRLITVVFRDKIVNHLSPGHRAVTLMLQANLITADDYSEIFAKFMASGAAPAMKILLDKIEESSEPRIYRSFVDILATSGDETCKLLADDIQGLTASSESEENGKLFRDVLQFYTADIIDQISPQDIVLHTPLADKQMILAICDMKGNRIGASYMMLELFRIPGDSWQETFLQALRDAGHNDLADKLAEGFKSKTDPSGASASKDKHKSHETEEETHKDTSDSSGEEGGNNEGGTQPEDEDIAVNLNSLDLEDEEENDGLRSPFRQPDQQTREQTTGTDGTEKQEEEGTEKQHAPPSADEKPSDLYEDQLEVALPAIEGKNVLIQMPTGAGKTVVAASVIEKVINDADEPMKCKVIFMVPTGPLVEQQQESLSKRLRPSRNFKITGLKGETMTIPLKSVLNSHNVIVLTAEILRSALRDRDHLVELDSLALLVFDECHHCMKEHVYNGIMKRYTYEKFEHPDVKLPQIIGLTATTGTGKAKSQIDAEDHVFQLICNLDTPYISIVEEHQNVLKERLNTLQEMNPVSVDPRADDPFKTEVCRIMSEIEDTMREEAGSLVPEVNNIPRDKKNQSYMQWLSKVNKNSKKQIKDGEKLRSVLACAKRLEEYHISLGINAEVRIKDAYDYVDSHYNIPLDQMDAYNNTEYKLFQMFVAKRRRFAEMSKDPKYNNPLLKTVAEIILREFKQTPKSRALLFCRTIEGTKALKTWIEESDDLRFLQPNRMVGGQSMTTAQHKEILDRFREGKHKLLVATKVLEEGIDVAACNLVMRLNYVPSDTGHEQSKGRGRAKHSKCYLIASSDCNHDAWEHANRARSGMSQRALESFRSLNTEELKSLMQKRQQEDYNQQMLEEEAAETVRPQHTGEFQLLCGKCLKFACSTFDIGIFKGSQHLVLDEKFILERSKVTKHPRAKKIDNEFSKDGKIFCKNCNHDWGIVAKVCGQRLPMIKISPFIIVKVEENVEVFRDVIKNWGDAKQIFHVNTLERGDLQTMKKMNIHIPDV